MIKESDVKRGIGKIVCNERGNNFCILNAIRLYSAGGNRLFILVLLDLENKIIVFSSIMYLLTKSMFKYGTSKGSLYIKDDYETTEDLLGLNILPSIITYVREYTSSLMRILYRTRSTVFNKIPKYKIIMRDLLKAHADPTSHLLVQYE